MACGRIGIAQFSDRVEVVPGDLDNERCQVRPVPLGEDIGRTADDAIPMQLSLACAKRFPSSVGRYV
jgi:hypothetical protein